MSLAHIPHLHYLWLIVASLIAGVMNAMAGGGSFLSFPAMLGVGVLPVQANATNTVALWPGQLTSLATLRGDLDTTLLPVVGLVCLLGGVSGAEGPAPHPPGHLPSPHSVAYPRRHAHLRHQRPGLQMALLARAQPRSARSASRAFRSRWRSSRSAFTSATSAPVAVSSS